MIVLDFLGPYLCIILDQLARICNKTVVKYKNATLLIANWMSMLQIDHPSIRSVS
jgi:hypothetical protein